MTVAVPPGSGTPCVTHAKEEEVYFVLEDELLMHTPTQCHSLRPGDMVHLPALTPCGYRVPGDAPARFVAWTVGGPMDHFFPTWPSPCTNCRDLARMQAVMAEHGLERVS